MTTDKNQSEEPKGPIGHTLSLLSKVFTVLLLSLLISIIVEWLGITFWWDDGHRHSQSLLEQEITYLNRDFKESLLASSPVDFVNKTAGRASHILFEESGVVTKLNEIRKNKSMAGFQGGLSRFYLGLEDYILSAINVVQLFLVRLSIMVLSLPLFILFCVVGVAEGLMQRDLRRWGGGRESGFIYHHAKRLAVPIFLLCWLVYLSLPISLHPNMVLIPFAVTMAGSVYVGVSRFKKYL